MNKKTNFGFTKVTTKQKNMIVSVDVDDFSFYDFLVKLDDHNLISHKLNPPLVFLWDLMIQIMDIGYRCSAAYSSNR